MIDSADMPTPTERGALTSAEHLDGQNRDAGEVNHAQPEHEHAFDREVSRVGAACGRFQVLTPARQPPVAACDRARAALRIWVRRGSVSIMSSPLSVRPARADRLRRAAWQSPHERG